MTRKEEMEEQARLELGDHCYPFIRGAEWSDQSMLKEIDNSISQLTMFAKTEHGAGQLAAWKEMRLFFK